jgi:hypothetical protein
MKPKARFEQMLTYIEHSLSQRGFNLNKTTDNHRFSLSKSGHKSGLLLMNKQIPMDEFYVLHRTNIRDFGIDWIVFYKDGETFFRRMVDTNAWRKNKSLKKYTAQQINQMIALTIQERMVMFNFEESKVKQFSAHHLKDKQLIYYQPPSERLEEGIRKFRPREVNFDYSHLTKDDEEDEDNRKYSHAIEGISKMYFFLDEIKR